MNTCAICNRCVRPEDALDHVLKCSAELVTCPICLKQFTQDKITVHAATCEPLLSHSPAPTQKPVSTPAPRADPLLPPPEFGKAYRHPAHPNHIYVKDSGCHCANINMYCGSCKLTDKLKMPQYSHIKFISNNCWCSNIRAVCENCKFFDDLKSIN